MKKLAEMTWQTWDHCNTVDNENEAATSSKEVDKRIREEYDQGFRNLSDAAHKLEQQPAELQMEKGFFYGIGWGQLQQHFKYSYCRSITQLEMLFVCYYYTWNDLCSAVELNDKIILKICALLCCTFFAHLRCML